MSGVDWFHGLPRPKRSSWIQELLFEFEFLIIPENMISSLTENSPTALDPIEKQTTRLA
jgi:hypothetical protein